MTPAQLASLLPLLQALPGRAHAALREHGPGWHGYVHIHTGVWSEPIDVMAYAMESEQGYWLPCNPLDILRAAMPLVRNGCDISIEQNTGAGKYHALLCHDEPWDDDEWIEGSTLTCGDTEHEAALYVLLSVCGLEVS